MKVVVTGSNGLLGQTLVDMLLKFPKQYQVYGLSRGKNISGRSDFEYMEVDLTNDQKLKDILTNIKPDAIVHTAAMTNVDACEEDKEGCLQLNIEVVKTISNVCKELNCYLVHISTDFIFDGQKGYYKETDVPNPLSFYGESKLQSENIVLNSGVSASILRTILVYGKVNNLKRNNIVLWVKEMLENKKEITIVDDQYRMPTYVVELALACKVCIDTSANGVFNISSSKLLSIFEIAKEIANVFELDSSYIQPISTAKLNQRANRPVKTGFDLTKTKTELNFHPKTFKEDLLKFKETLL